MPLTKSKGNMYDWVTHCHTHLGGQCPHKCSYCYVQRNRFGVSEKYQGDIRLLEKELAVDYGKDKRIFIDHMNDMFANGVKTKWIYQILEHCCKYPDNQYVFQTKNPANALLFMQHFPKNFLIGTTIETDSIDVLMGKSQAPDPIDRYSAMLEWSYYFPKKTFVTIEPIMAFNVATLSGWIRGINPLFVNIGADSKHSELDEPDAEDIKELVRIIQESEIEIRKKINLERILGIERKVEGSE